MRVCVFLCVVFLVLVVMIFIVVVCVFFVEEVFIECLCDDVVVLVFIFIIIEYEFEWYFVVMVKFLCVVFVKLCVEMFELWFGCGCWNVWWWGVLLVVVKLIGAEAFGTWRADEDVEWGWWDVMMVFGGMFCVFLSVLGMFMVVMLLVLGFNVWDGEASSARRASDVATVKYASLS